MFPYEAFNPKWEDMYKTLFYSDKELILPLKLEKKRALKTKNTPQLLVSKTKGGEIIKTKKLITHKVNGKVGTKETFKLAVVWDILSFSLYPESKLERVRKRSTI